MILKYGDVEKQITAPKVIARLKRQGWVEKGAAVEEPEEGDELHEEVKPKKGRKPKE